MWKNTLKEYQLLSEEQIKVLEDNKMVKDLVGEELDHYIYCKGYYDIEFFTDTLLTEWKEHPVSGKFVKTPWYHKEIWKAIDDDQKLLNIIIARWHGKTTALLMYMIHSICYRKHKVILYLASWELGKMGLGKIRREFEVNEDLLRIFGNLVPSNSDDLKDRKLSRWRQQEMEFLNGIVIRTMTCGQKIRWHRPSLIIWDDVQENSDVKNPIIVEEFNRWMWTSLDKTLMPWGKKVILGTIVGNICYVNYLKNKGVRTIEYTACDEDFGNILRPEMFTKEFFQEEAEFDLDDFNQERRNIPMIVNGRPVFRTKDIDELEILWWIDEEDGVRIYGNPNLDCFWGVDTSWWGISGDYSTIIVRDRDMNLKACYQWHIPPDQLCDVIDYLWNKGFWWVIGVEKNNTGISTIDAARDYSWFQNMYAEKSIDKITNKKTKKVGWNTNRATKPLMIEELKKELKDLKGIDERELLEFKNYYHDEKGSYNAIAPNHDDLIIAEAICLQMIKRSTVSLNIV